MMNFGNLKKIRTNPGTCLDLHIEAIHDFTAFNLIIYSVSMFWMIAWFFWTNFDESRRILWTDFD